MSMREVGADCIECSLGYLEPASQHSFHVDPATLARDLEVGRPRKVVSFQGVICAAPARQHTLALALIPSGSEEDRF